MLLQHAGRLEAQALDDEGARIDDDAMQAREVILVAVEEQQARLGGDRHAHLLGDLEAVAAGEALFGEEDLHVALQLRAQVARQAQVGGHAGLEDGAPSGGEGKRAKAPASSLPQPRGHRDGDDGQCSDDCDQEQRLHARPSSNPGTLHLGAGMGHFNPAGPRACLPDGPQDEQWLVRREKDWRMMGPRKSRPPSL